MQFWCLTSDPQSVHYMMLENKMILLRYSSSNQTVKMHFNKLVWYCNKLETLRLWCWGSNYLCMCTPPLDSNWPWSSAAEFPIWKTWLKPPKLACWLLGMLLNGSSGKRPNTDRRLIVSHHRGVRHTLVSKTIFLPCLYSGTRAIVPWVPREWLSQAL